MYYTIKNVSKVTNHLCCYKYVLWATLFYATAPHSQTHRHPCRMLLGVGSKNSSDVAVLLWPRPRPLGSVNQRPKQDGRQQELGLLFNRQVLFFNIIMLKSVCCPLLYSKYFFCHFQLLRNHFWFFFLLCLHSLCRQFVWSQCRDQVYHSCWEVIYIRADERDFPEWLWTFVQTLR